jgi:signal transduction histidine kinase
VYVQVSDTGSGIAGDVIDRIWDPFFTTKEVGKGVGLGLALSYNIVKRHGGEISVKSTVGKGSQFTVRLPVRCEQEDSNGSGF